MSVQAASLIANKAAPATEDADKYRLALDELMDMAMDVARLVHGEAKTLADAPPTEDTGDATARAKLVAVIAAAFDRAARTVRRTANLARHIDDPIKPSGEPGPDHTAARRDIIRAVEDTIQEKASGERAEALRAELFERMDCLDIDEEIDRQTRLLDVINMIRKDLGLPKLAGIHDYKRRTPEDVAELCARAARLPLPPRTAHGAEPGPTCPSGVRPSAPTIDPAMIRLCDKLLHGP